MERPGRSGEGPRVMELVRSFHVGGTEGQLLELVRRCAGGCRLSVGVLDRGGPLAEEVARVGFAPALFPLEGTLLRANTLRQVVRLARLLTRGRVEVLHAHDFYATTLAVPAARLAGCKVVVGRLDLAHWYGPARRAVLTLLTRLADHVVANALAIKRMLLREEGVSERRVTVIRNGIDLADFDRRALMLDGPVVGLDGGGPVVVLVANMAHPVKRQEDLLEAVRLLKPSVPGLSALFVGDGPRRRGLEDRARMLGLQGTAHFVGLRRDVPAILARATVGVLCSSAEGLSNAIVEGMAARLPMVVTRVGGNVELVEAGVSGLWVDPGEPASLAKAIGDLLETPGRRKQMGEAGRCFVERELSLERMVAAHRELYGRLAAQGLRT